MNTDSIDVKDSILNIYLTRILKILDDSFLDPLMKVYCITNIGEFEF